ncbi:putative B3 domain-containing protein At5g66980 [Silene latifolia]|uniref:putative B3 domain-containing protein At5g66980 n=1 Tax=Silene latifolia TaxID=37657 RepID=UPI003D777BFD
MAPEFFAVFLPEFCSHQLKITSGFKAHLEKEVTGEAIIERSDTNMVWKVDLVKEGEDFLFKNGWNEFVTENGVTIGDFMVFQYHGNSWFTVDIFGTDGLEKLTPGKRALVNDDDDDDEDYDVVDETAKAVGGMKI